MRPPRSVWLTDWWRGLPAAVALILMFVFRVEGPGEGSAFVLFAVLLAVPNVWDWPSRWVLVQRMGKSSLVLGVTFVAALLVFNTVSYAHGWWKVLGGLGLILLAVTIAVLLVMLTGVVVAHAARAVLWNLQDGRLIGPRGPSGPRP